MIKMDGINRCVSWKHASLVAWLLVIHSFNLVSTQNDKIMACYFLGDNFEDFSGKDVDPFLCTHIICADAVLTPDGIETVQPIGIQQYQAVASLKKQNPDLKVMVSAARGFQSLVDQPSVDVIMKFALKAVMFLEKMNMDGIDLDWEFPHVYEKEQYILFIKILGTYLHSSNLLLSMALPAMPYSVDTGYDVATLNEYMDFITVMTYDFHGYSKGYDNTTGYNSPLYTPKGDYMYKSTAEILSYLLYKGFSKDKLLMGIPAYGRSWTLVDPKVHGLHSPANAVGEKAPHSSMVGMFDYADVCVIQSEGATIVQDEVNIGEYLYNGSTWSSFEGKFSIARKMQWLWKRDLAGVGIWAYQYDDYSNICGQGQMPLLNWLREKLQNPI